MAQVRKILVTGGLGFIGCRVACNLLQADHQVCITDTCTNYGIIPQQELDHVMTQRTKLVGSKAKIYHEDIADPIGMDSIMRSQGFDVVIHMASFPRQKVVNANPMAGSRTMSEGLLNLMELSVKHKVQRFVYISSSMVYGDFADGVSETATCRPQGQYGIMKLAGEWLVRDYSRRGLFDHVIIRPSAVYGEMDVEDRVVSKFMLEAMRGGTLQVNGASETLDFTHVQDIADGITKAATLPVARNKTYNITKSQSWTLLDAANLTVRIAGRGIVDVRDRDTNFPSRGALSIEAARRELGFNPQIDIEQGFQRYHDWLKDSVYWSPKTI